MHPLTIYLIFRKEKHLHKVIDLRICVAELVKIWENDVSEPTIKNCFAKAGFSVLPKFGEQDVFPLIQHS